MNNIIKILVIIVILALVIYLTIKIRAKILKKEPYNIESTGPVNSEKNLTFQEEASIVIGNVAFPNFYNCIVKDPNSCVRTDQILSIRDNLDMLNFAYFPLKNSVTYNRINPDSTLRPVITNDPVTIVLYYSAEMYTIFGAVEDAMSTNHSDPSLEKYRDTLFNEVRRLFSNLNMTNDVTWIDYFKYPGPYGTAWDGKIVTWTLDIKLVENNYDIKYGLKRALYLNLSTEYPSVIFRQQNSQFWQDKIPKQNTLLIKGLKELIKIQCDTVIKRYKNLLEINKNGDWDKSILKAGGENIDIYHKLRKSIRSMSRAIENYPIVLDVFNKNVPDNFMKFINTFDQSSTPSSSTLLTYKDIIIGTSQKYIIGYLFFVNDDKSDFFNLTKLSTVEYNSLRTLIYFKTLRVGYKNPLVLANIKNGLPASLPSFFKNTVFCPSISRTPPMKAELASVNNIPNEIYKYQSPKFVNNNFEGSYCEIDNFMGDIHDYSVLYQKNLDNQEYRNIKDLEKYVKTGATAIKNMFKDINLVKVVNDLKQAL